MSAMKQQYGSEQKAEEVFFASKNKGTISGVDVAASLAPQAINKMTEMKDPLPHGASVAPRNARVVEIGEA